MVNEDAVWGTVVAILVVGLIGLLCWAASQGGDGTYTVNPGDEFDGDDLKYVSISNSSNEIRIQVRETVDQLTTGGHLADDNCVYLIVYNPRMSFGMDEHDLKGMRLDGQTLTCEVSHS